MPSKTVSLEESAYEELRAAKAPEESFSDAVHRILADSRPSFRQLAGVLTATEADAVRKAVRRMRDLEVPAEERQMKSWGKGRGSRSGH